MPSKRRKYNARFPAGRIKKIMQTDEQVGKVAQAVPIIISRTLELFVQSLLNSAMMVTNAKNARTLSPSHMKQCIVSESRFNFLKDLVRRLPDVNTYDEEGPASANSSIAEDGETLRNFSGRKFVTPRRKSSPGGEAHASKHTTSNEEESDADDGDDLDESESDKESAVRLEDANSDFVIDEDYGA